jgi:hypothetical protein
VYKIIAGCLLLLAGFIQGCPAHTLLTKQDQEKIQASHAQKAYFLKQSFFVGPFFAYDDRNYISERAFDERVLIQSPGGDPILPCEPTGVLSMGTRVTVRQIEFPTSSAMASRKLKSPRHFTWVLLDVDGQPSEKPYVLVLTQEFKKIQEFESSLKDYLLTEDPRKQFSTYAPEEITAIDKKTLIKGMHADALLRSRGHPDRITRKFVEGVKTERWQYTPDRVVVLKEDRVDSWQGFPDLLAPEGNKPEPEPGS